jgi:hypothetical protein
MKHADDSSFPRKQESSTLGMYENMTLDTRFRGYDKNLRCIENDYVQ